MTRSIVVVALLSGCAADRASAPRAARAHRVVAVAPVAQESPVCLVAGTLVRGRTASPRRDEVPRHSVEVPAFCMDRTLVTRAAFARFIDDTRYRTSAERLGYGFESLEGMDDWEWRRAPGANWRRPFSVENPDTRGFLRDDAPAVMLSWRDAGAYCAWRHGKLPTEVQWEYAMGAGTQDRRYPWGDSPDEPPGTFLLNFWQGASHLHNDRRDGYVYVSPVRAFPANRWGLHDPVGNVWQWTADAYRADANARSAEPEGAISDPWPGDSEVPLERVTRGGSWWCARCTCEGYGLLYRGHTDERAPFSNNGFRCVYDPRGAAES